MLLLAAISCMMVANPGTPDSKKKTWTAWETVCS